MQQLLEVSLRDGQPHSFRWRTRTYRIKKIIDSWHERGEWWHGEEETWWWRVQTSDLGVFEIGWRPSDKTWWMGRKWD